MNDETSEPRTNWGGFERLKEVLPYLPGSYSVDTSRGLAVCVTAYDGPSPLSDGIDLDDSRAVQAVQDTFDRLQIPAEVSPNEGIGLGGVRIELTTVQGADALAEWAISTLPPEIRALRRLYLTLVAGQFRHRDDIGSRNGGIMDLHLDVDQDLPKLRKALGLPEDDTVINTPCTLYPYAKRFAKALGEKLGADGIEVEAYPHRPFCGNCSGDVIVVGRLAPEQADRISAALEAAQAGSTA
ncbi:hypothetical protein [Streptomyces sp. NPDC058861]|uniref:hypothetical protein n=1 Tax=Streptomyces sp. NPDC058861 TaxID=3346653 RepID=UPI0036B09C4A